MDGKVYLDNLPKIQPIEVYTNLGKVELLNNGKSLGAKKPDKLGKAVWEVDFNDGENRIYAKGKDGKAIVEDYLAINYKTHSTNLKPGEELNINLGFNAEFIDENETIWLPDLKYTKGAYGAVKGEPYMANKDLIVVNTRNRPVLYNYSLDGAEAYQLDVPDGEYLVKLHFAETKYFQPGKRVFDVEINDIPVFKDLDIFSKYGFLTAFSKTFTTEANNSKGIKVKLNAKNGTTLISAIQIKRVR
jgi:beta-galactosidase